MFLHQFGRDTDDVLTLPVLDHVERLQRADDVTLRDAGHLAVDGTEASCDPCFKHDDEGCVLLLRPHRCAEVPEVFNGQGSSEVSQDLQQNPRPVAPIAQLAQIRQRFLWRTHGALELRQLVT